MSTEKKFIKRKKKTFTAVFRSIGTKQTKLFILSEAHYQIKLKFDLN